MELRHAPKGAGTLGNAVDDVPYTKRVPPTRDLIAPVFDMPGFPEIERSKGGIDDEGNGFFIYRILPFNEADLHKAKDEADAAFSAQDLAGGKVILVTTRSTSGIILGISVMAMKPQDDVQYQKIADALTQIGEELRSRHESHAYPLRA